MKIRFLLTLVGLLSQVLVTAQSHRKGQFFIAPILKDQPHEIIVKLKPGYSHADFQVGGKLSPIANDLETYHVSFRKGINLPDPVLTKMQLDISKRTRNSIALGLKGYVRLHTGTLDSEKLLSLAEKLESYSEVEYCELIPQKRPAPPMDPLENRQTWRYASGFYNGLDFEYAWSVNAKGQGVTVRDIEYAWNTQHEDLRNQPIRYADGLTQIQYTGNDVYSFVEHGTCIAGIICAEADNNIGIKGGAPEIKEMVLYAEETVEHGWDRVTSMAQMVSESSPGDVILLEIQMYGPNNQYVPAEYGQAIWDLTRMAVDKGVIVLTTGGNGGENLDSPDYTDYMNRGSSGSIMIGAGNANDRSRMNFSTYGSRFDVQFWGGGIVSTGAFNGNAIQGSGNSAYTGTFGGTSGAGGLAAAFAAATQSYAMDKLGRNLAPWEMKKLWVENALPQGGNTSQKIGPMPTLDRVLKAIDSYSPAITLQDYLDDQTLNFNKQYTFDLSTIFQAAGDISYDLVTNNTPEFASASLSGEILTVNTSDKIGSTYIQVSGRYGGETIYEDFIVTVWDESLTRIHHDSDNNIGIGFGDEGSAEFVAVTRLTSDELGPYYGSSKLVGVQFYISTLGGPVWSSIIPQVYTGDGNGPSEKIFDGPELASQVTAGQWYYYLMDPSEEIDIESGKDYFVGYYINESKGFPVGVDAGPAIVDKGDWVKVNDGDWENMSVDWTIENYRWDYNFNIRALVRDLTVGNLPVELAGLRVYPNPVTDVLQFSVPIDNPVIRDMQGRVVLARESGMQIDVSELPVGTYLLSGQVNGVNLLHKIVRR